MTIKMSTQPCGFCQTDKHDYCPGVVGAEHRYQCPCGCPKSTDKTCKVCGDKSDVRDDTWICTEPAACVLRVDRKRQQVREHLYPHGAPDTVLQTKTGNDCNCGCGEQTSGGLFRPGHADKHAKNIAEMVKTGTLTKEQAIGKLNAISPGLIKKLEARL